MLRQKLTFVTFFLIVTSNFMEIKLLFSECCFKKELLVSYINSWQRLLSTKCVLHQKSYHHESF